MCKICAKMCRGPIWTNKPPVLWQGLKQSLSPPQRPYKNTWFKQTACRSNRLAGCNFVFPEKSRLVISLPGAARAIRDRHLQFACFHQRQYILTDGIGGRLNSQKGSNFLPGARNCAIGKQVRLCPITTRFCRLHGMTESHHKFSAMVFKQRLRQYFIRSRLVAEFKFVGKIAFD